MRYAARFIISQRQVRDFQQDFDPGNVACRIDKILIRRLSIKIYTLLIK